MFKKVFIALVCIGLFHHHHLFARKCHACGGCGQAQASVAFAPSFAVTSFAVPQVVVPQVIVPQVQFQAVAVPQFVQFQSFSAVRGPRVIRQRTVIRN